jgi:hypothetical protein
MRARGAPVSAPVMISKTIGSNVSFVTRNNSPVKRSKERPKRAGTPVRKRTKKPPSVTGYHWRREGVGWDLRKDTYVTGNDGVRKRKQPFVAHLSRSAFAEMQRRHKGAQLEKGIAQWIADHDH